MGVTPGKPLADIRAFVAKLRSHDGIGALPPIVLAALRRRMVALAGEIADGVLFANASLSHMAQSLAGVPGGQARRPEIPDRQHAADLHLGRREAAKAVHRRRLVRYALLPNYRNYWKEAGYGEEMAAIERPSPRAAGTRSRNS